MTAFTITGFADEISPKLAEQIQVLKENNIHNIEIRGINGKNVSEFTLDEAKAYKAELTRHEINVSSIASPIGKIKITDDFEQQKQLFEHVLQLAEIFQSPFVRVFSFYLESDAVADRYQDEVFRRWQAFMTIAANYPRITLLHENEKEIFGDTPERCALLLQRINSPQLRAAFDPANFVQCGVQVYPHAYELLRPYIAYVHIKDAYFKNGEVTPAGLGDGQVAQVLEQLAKDNYQGYLSLEPHLSTFEGYERLESKAVSINHKKSNGARTFTIASNALKELLVEQLGQKWE
ncbi:sugar phosphate isomerase/epimerase family protein [Lapidilactobacillus luobeiensis]|uniref:sugar phosphate isomerase/epimerase family protein n=1 Tax=Lapidilactobacillus luobeiensis TaxID=2950371 RepID=UPI0021C2C8CC|nr:sugar phosphate isomerase/epimerase [Lapidilactobacillus luobeiensis]